jgi:hypothetical protein
MKLRCNASVLEDVTDGTTIVGNANRVTSKSGGTITVEGNANIVTVLDGRALVRGNCNTVRAKTAHVVGDGCTVVVADVAGSLVVGTATTLNGIGQQKGAGDDDGDDDDYDNVNCFQSVVDATVVGGVFAPRSGPATATAEPHSYSSFVGSNTLGVGSSISNGSQRVFGPRSGSTTPGSHYKSIVGSTVVRSSISWGGDDSTGIVDSTMITAREGTHKQRCLGHVGRRLFPDGIDVDPLAHCFTPSWNIVEEDSQHGAIRVMKLFPLRPCLRWCVLFGRAVGSCLGGRNVEPAQ